MRSNRTNTLPAAISGETDQPVQSPEPAKPTELNNKRSLRILVVEDNDINQRVASCLLESRGHSVMVAQNGLVALSCLEAEHFDLVLMDVQMPEMSGFEATAAIRDMESKTGAHTPIVATTAHAMTGDRERCLAAGMDDYLPKPIKPSELFRVVEALLSASTLIDPTEPQTSTAPAGETLLDRSALLASVGGNVEMLAKIASLFLKKYPIVLSDISTTVRQGDGASLARAAHTLRGGGGAFLTKSAIEILTRLEGREREGDLTNADANLIELGREMALIEVELTALVTEAASLPYSDRPAVR